MSTDFSEDTLVEQPAIALFKELGYETANCFYEKVGTSDSTLGRETTEGVILVPKLRSALRKLNPDLDDKAVNLAIEELTRDRSAMSLVQANREVYKLLYYLASGGRILSRERHRDDQYDLAKVLENPFLEHISRILDRFVRVSPSRGDRAQLLTT